MTTVLVYNNSTRRIERYYKNLSDPMPYTSYRWLTVGEFRGSSKSSVIWTDKTFMQTYNGFRSYYGNIIPVGYAFKRIWEGGHGQQSQHYAGGAFDVGHILSATQRRILWNSAKSYGKWSYVEPISLTPTWVHFDKRLFPPACTRGGYILVKYGSRGVYVLILQDALNALGFTGSGLDGIFGAGTKRALIAFQRANGLAADGICGCLSWTAINSMAIGIGLTSTVVNP